MVVNVKLVTMGEAGVLEDAVVVVRNGVVSELASSLDLLQTSRPEKVIDGAGGYLVPGYVDAHIHYRHPDELLNYLAFGVTTVVSLGQSPEESAGLQAMRAAISRGEEIGPQIYATDGIIANGVTVEDPESGREYVRTLAGSGFDLVKIYNDTPRDVFDAVVDEAQRLGLSVFGHIPRNYPAEYSLDNGLRVVAHAEEFYFTWFEGARDADLDDFAASDLPDMQKAGDLVELILRNDIAVIPGLGGGFAHMVFWDDDASVFADPELRYLHPRLTSLWASMNLLQRKPLDKRMLRERIKYAFTHELTRRMHDAGVLIVTGTDAALPNQPPGKSLHRELRELVKTGLTYQETLATTTSDAGRFIRKYVDPKARIGIIEEGYEADLVLLDDNPLENIRNAASIRGVMSNGRWFPSSTLGELREERASRYRALRSLAEDVKAAVRAGAGAVDIQGRFQELGVDDDDARDFVRHLIEGLGFEAFAREDVDEVLRIVTLNTRLFPDSADAWDTLGEVYAFLERRDEALEAYRRALAIDPGFDHARTAIQALEGGVRR